MPYFSRMQMKIFCAVSYSLCKFLLIVFIPNFKISKVGSYVKYRRDALLCGWKREMLGFIFISRVCYVSVF